MPNRLSRAGSGPVARQAAGQRGQEALLHLHPVAAADRPDQLAPERGVPRVAAAPLPVQDPVRPVDQVLVEEVGDPRGELMAAEVVVRIREVGAERRERRLRRRAWAAVPISRQIRTSRS